MNHSIYKILKYEFKLNIRDWTLILVASLAILVSFFIKVQSDNRSVIFAGSAMVLVIFLISIFTIHAYSESTSRQEMELYHLLPVSRNLKFFSKQIITIIIYPVTLAGIYLIFVIAFDLVSSNHLNRSIFGSISLKSIELFIWSHSIATLFAIIFKKRKIIYALVTYFLLSITFGLLFTFVQKIFGNDMQVTVSNVISAKLRILPSSFFLIIPAILYIISYRLFFRRQL